MRYLRKPTIRFTILAILAFAGSWILQQKTFLPSTSLEDLFLNQMSPAVGFRLASVTVDGRKKTTTEAILKSLGVQTGDPIFDIDVESSRQRLQALPWVQSAKVGRQLPRNLHIVLEERNAFAIWQRGYRHTLVDRTGEEILDRTEGYEHLPIIVGPIAPKKAGNLFQELANETLLFEKIRAAVHIGQRRWNIILRFSDTDITIKLPEVDPKAAWVRLARLQQEHKLLDRDINAIDLRFKDKLIVRTSQSKADQTKSPTQTTQPDNSDLRNDEKV